MATATTTAAMASVATQSFIITEVKGKAEAEATPEVLALVKRAVDLQRRENALKAEREEIRDRLGAIMGDQGIDRIVSAGTVRVTRSVSTPNRIDTGRLREEYPDLAEALTVQGAEQVRVTVK